MTEGTEHENESSADVLTAKDAHGGFAMAPVVAVTGSAGFVGSHVADALLAAGYRVRGFDNGASGVDFTPKGVERVACDIAANLRSDDLDDVAAVVHCAAYAELRHNWDGPDGGLAERRRLFRNNEIATLSVLEKMPARAPLVFLSSASVYGSQCHRTGSSALEEAATPRDIESPYAASKLACESYVAAYAYKNGRPWWCLRLVNQVGPRQHRGVIADFVRMARTGHVHAADDGSQRKSWVDVRDTAEAIVSLLRDRRAPGSSDGAPWLVPSGIYNMTSAARVSWKDIVEIMIEMAPRFPLEVTHEARPVGAVGDPRDIHASGSKLRPWYRADRPIGPAIRLSLAGLGWVESALRAAVNE